MENTPTSMRCEVAMEFWKLISNLYLKCNGWIMYKIDFKEFKFQNKKTKKK